MSEKKTTTKSRAPKADDLKNITTVPKKEKGTVIAVRPAFVLVEKLDGSSIKVRGVSAKVGDEIEF